MARLKKRLPGGKLCCPDCGRPDKVQSDGWQWGRIRKLVTLNGVMYVLFCKYCCVGCPGE